MQEVQVYVKMCGDYCAFHEADLTVVYDVTNDIQLQKYNGKSLEELEAFEFDEYCDYQLFNAIKVDNDYYVKL